VSAEPRANDADLRAFRFSVLDVENLRLHYAKTLEHWLERYEANVERVAQMFDATFVRVWRLYLAGSLAAFRSGDMQLFQVSFNRSGQTGFRGPGNTCTRPEVSRWKPVTR